MENIYLYRHRRLDTNDVFYVGIGINKRAYVKSNRSVYWKRVVNITDYKVEILISNICLEDAKELEIFLIQLYGRKDLGLGKLINMTNGGDGMFGYKQSDETKSKIRNSQLGEKGYWFGKTREQSVRDEMSRVRKLNPPGLNKKHTKESKALLSKSMLGSTNAAKLVLDTQTGVFFNSLKEAAIAYNLNERTLSDWLNNKRKNNTNLVRC